MSIGITYTLEDRVLLITDSRRIYNFDSDNERIDDDAEKIHNISPQIAAIGVGIEQGIEIALNTLKVSIDENSSIDRISNALMASIEVGLKGLEYLVTSDIDINTSYFKVGLLIGGVAENRLFTMGLTRSVKSKNKPVIRVGKYEGLTIGMDNLKISDQFTLNVDNLFAAHKHSNGQDNQVFLTEKIIKSTETIIKEVAKENEMISDKITHTIIYK
ncbi:MAG: hypothetical protein ACR2MD_15915 [Aridibacter sp.]